MKQDAVVMDRVVVNGQRVDIPMLILLAVSAQLTDDLSVLEHRS